MLTFYQFLKSEINIKKISLSLNEIKINELKKISFLIEALKFNKFYK